MKRALALLVLGACAPKADYTPQIAVEPGAWRRICYVCTERKGASEAECPPDIAERCGILTSDVKPFPARFTPGDEPDGSIVDDEGSVVAPAPQTP
jgi:hypothetical protein